jgi:hypothetical protein
MKWRDWEAAISSMDIFPKQSDIPDEGTRRAPVILSLYSRPSGSGTEHPPSKRARKNPGSGANFHRPRGIERPPLRSIGRSRHGCGNPCGPLSVRSAACRTAPATICGHRASLKQLLTWVREEAHESVAIPTMSETEAVADVAAAMMTSAQSTRPARRPSVSSRARRVRTLPCSRLDDLSHRRPSIPFGSTLISRILVERPMATRNPRLLCPAQAGCALL